MIGCRPLNSDEIEAIKSKLSMRDATFFVLGLRTGFRVSELLSIKVKDVCQYGHVVDRLSVARRNMKGEHAGRSVALHQEAKDFIALLIKELHLSQEDFLFKSSKGGAISRIQAYRMLRKAVEAVELTGKIATHSMRKSFAKGIYERSKRDLMITQKALGHKSVGSTISYLESSSEDLDKLLLE